MPLRTLPYPLAACALACALTAVAAQATPASTTAATPKTAQKHKSGSARLIKNPNHETPAERERRLARECQGMPNAGACLGYGQ